MLNVARHKVKQNKSLVHIRKMSNANQKDSLAKISNLGVWVVGWKELVI